MKRSYPEKAGSGGRKVSEAVKHTSMQTMAFLKGGPQAAPEPAPTYQAKRRDLCPLGRLVGESNLIGADRKGPGSFPELGSPTTKAQAKRQ